MIHAEVVRHGDTEEVAVYIPAETLKKMPKKEAKMLLEALDEIMASMGFKESGWKSTNTSISS